jgi:hypothetical protein
MDVLQGIQADTGGAAETACTKGEEAPVCPPVARKSIRWPVRLSCMPARSRSSRRSMAPCAGIGLDLRPVRGPALCTTAEAKFTTVVCPARPDRGAWHRLAVCRASSGRQRRWTSFSPPASLPGAEAAELGLVNASRCRSGELMGTCAAHRPPSSPPMVSPRSVAVMKQQVRKTYFQSPIRRALLQKQMLQWRKASPHSTSRKAWRAFVERRTAQPSKDE